MLIGTWEKTDVAKRHGEPTSDKNAHTAANRDVMPNVEYLPGILVMIKAGDIFEIHTSKGTAYFQFVKKLPLMGSLIRVLPGVYENSPPAWLNLVNQETNFWIFFPVSAAMKKGIVKKAHHVELPDHARQTPVFRSGVVDPQTRKVRTWWLWDGEKEWRIDTITEEQRKLPILGSWNDTLLVERIEQDWRPEKDLR